MSLCIKARQLHLPISLMDSLRFQEPLIAFQPAHNVLQQYETIIHL